MLINKVLAATTDIQQVLDAPASGQKFFAYTNIGQMVQNVLKVSLSIGGILVLLFIIWGAIDYISSQGDKQQYEGARNKITYAIIGLAILAVAYASWYFILTFLGIGKLTPGDSETGTPGQIEFQIDEPAATPT